MDLKASVDQLDAAQIIAREKVLHKENRQPVLILQREIRKPVLILQRENRKPVLILQREIRKPVLALLRKNHQQMLILQKNALLEIQHAPLKKKISLMGVHHK